MIYHRLHKGHVLGGAAVLAIPLAIFAPKAIAPMFAVAAVAGLAADFVRERRLPGLPRRWAVLFALVIGWGVLSALWSITPGRSLYLNLPLSVTYLGGLVLVSLARRLHGDERRFFETAFIVGIILGFALLAIEIFTPLALTSVIVPLVKGLDLAEYRKWIYAIPAYSAPNFYKPGAIVAVLLAWPAATLLWRRNSRVGAAAFAAAVIFILFNSSIETSLFGLIAGVAAFAVAWFFRRRAIWIFAALIVLGVSVAPLVKQIVPNTTEIARVAPNLPEGFFPRIFIWRQVSGLIAENPIAGKGLDTSRAISPNDERIIFTGKGGTPRDSVRIPLHPHNAILQVWLELGAVGAGLLLVILLALVRNIAVTAEGGVVRALGFGAFFCALAIACISHGIWQSWWQGVLWLDAAFMAAMLSDRDNG